MAGVILYVVSIEFVVRPYMHKVTRNTCCILNQHINEQNQWLGFVEEYAE